MAGADTGLQIPRPNQSLSPSQVAPGPRVSPRPVTLLCPPVPPLLTPGSGLCSSLGLRAAAEWGGRTPLLPPGGPPAVPPLPPAAPPARPPSLTCSARHGALRGWGSPAGAARACVCVRVRACVRARARAGRVTRSVSELRVPGRGCCAPQPTSPPPPQLPSRGRPRGGAVSIYSPSVPPLAASFLPAQPGPRLPPPHVSFPFPGPCARRPRAGSQTKYRGAGRRTAPSRLPVQKGSPVSDRPWVAGVGWQAGFGGGHACLRVS